MRATFAAVLILLAVDAYAWMEKWAPAFKSTPANYRALPVENVRAFVETLKSDNEYKYLEIQARFSKGATLDLNGDGIDDFVFIIPWMGCGLGGDGYWAHFLVSDGAKGRMENIVDCYGAELTDLVKVGGKAYFRQSNHFSGGFEKSKHNHWVYQIFSFGTNGVMRCANAEVGRPFPAVTIHYINPKFKQIELTESDLKRIAEETKIVSRTYAIPSHGLPDARTDGRP